MTTPNPAKKTAITAENVVVPANAIAAINEFLSVKLDDEEYEIDILRVQEMRSYEVSTRMANTPDFIKGVVMDSASDVILVALEQMRPWPQISSSICSDHILAIGSVQDCNLILRHIESLMPSPEMGAISNSVH